MQATIAVIEGDGIGVEVVPHGVRALRTVAQRFGHEFKLVPTQLGYTCWKRTGVAAPPGTIELCRNSDGVLLGAIGVGQWAHARDDLPPSGGRRQFDRELDHTLSVREVKVSPHTIGVSPIKAERIRGTDLVMVRDKSLLNVDRFKHTERTPRGRLARDTLEFYEDEIRRALKFAFLLARSRRRKLCLMAQASMFATSKLWAQLFGELAADYADVEIEVQAPDYCTMQLVRNPAVFDVIVSDSAPMGGMINSLAAMIMGSVGMGAGTTIGLRDGDTFTGMIQRNGLYESIHGSADARAGQGIVNPIGAILAAAMLLRYSLGLESEALAIERGVDSVLAQGYRTYDIMEPGRTQVGTEEMGERIALAIEGGA